MPITLNGDTGITTPLDVEIQGSTSGSITLAAPAVAGSSVITFPTGTGTASINGLSTNIVSGTTVASTSGTSIDFTGIPSWVKRITVMFEGVSTNGASNRLIQIGSGSFTTTGYVSSSSYISTTVNTASSTAGFIIWDDSAAFILSGHMVLTLMGSNKWISSHVGKVATTQNCIGGGNVSLSNTLDRIRITTVNGTDAFDAGSINILYE